MSFRGALYRQLDDAARQVFTDARAYPLGEVPQDIPGRFVAFERIGNSHVRHLTGGSGLASPRYEISAWARRLKDAEALADRLRELMDNLANQVIGTPEEEYGIRAVFLEDDSHDFVAPTDASRDGRHAIRMDFVIWHAESVSPVV